MLTLKKTILLLWSLTLLALPFATFAKEEVKKVEKVSTEVKEVEKVSTEVEEVDTVEEEEGAVEEVEKVDINTALAETLASKLDGIGMKKAEAIVKFREENGPFKAVIDLLNVDGIGEKTLEKNKDKLTVSVPEEDQPSEPASKDEEKPVTTKDDKKVEDSEKKK
ncbi:MAG: hypothetical protein BWK79_10610 [Beggiatoa sp. IS2]|nr:MAG: hypothetical protein BWK79_10610 [Beggiatoa sp. IS2]